MAAFSAAGASPLIFMPMYALIVTLCSFMILSIPSLLVELACLTKWIVFFLGPVELLHCAYVVYANTPQLTMAPALAVSLTVLQCAILSSDASQARNVQKRDAQLDQWSSHQLSLIGHGIGQSIGEKSLIGLNW
jgi:hypothetical protein